MRIPDDQIAEFRRLYADCYACGLSNPIGLHLDGFHRRSETEIAATFDPRPEHRGTVGSLHGGVIAAALDEICAWTAVLLADTMAVTATLDLRFRRPGDPTGRYRLIGSLGDSSGRRLRINGVLEKDDAVVAEARGVFLATDPVGALWPAEA
ncbi:MAG: PaaI family thioesterase [Acidimicrobiia bacterium]|nr:PaaI family thioesterase [Acidimicrobiia bacterium]NNF89069.1 PaaI family thioesterase [Acidimicrobiia bacterium]NNJ47305.1 PaaI family thioesterase [Acidimicrobiia bacterium]NNL14019.1 PaaI family thioesterase [Acidimicrobiia bacterium]NNL96793.1 PaaI family thioesterase [Acidimicrobiia bacterium]